MPDRLTVRVPATSANLGPGFDSLGIALDIAADVTLSTTPLEGARDQAMVQAAFRAAYTKAGRDVPPELSVSIASGFPVARGLGASAAFRAAGIVAANAMMGRVLGDDELLALGAEQEGHADNMAPALFGGLQIVVRDSGRGRENWHRLAVPVADGLKVVLLIPDFEMPTNQSRKKLPQQLSREDTVFNVGRAGLLVAALTQGRWDLLDVATQDKIHQPARAGIFPALNDILASAKDGGAHAAYLSGGGSSVAALVTQNEERVARLMQQAAVSRGYSARTVITRPSLQGARVVD
jgi:homoserine kinase